MGVGLGGYQYNYQAYISEITGIDPGLLALNLNMFDASSLFLRTAAELGLPGLIAIFTFLIVCGRVTGHPYVLLRNALVPYLLIRMGRYGSYFSLEFYFFVGLYLLNYMHSRNEKKTTGSAV
jgi:hypothetical protein